MDDKKGEIVMKIDSNLLKVMMEIGFLGTRHSRLNESATVFGGIAKARPKSAYPQIGLGSVAMGHGDFSKAVDILRNSPATEQAERDLCDGFLGMALKLAGYEDESRTVLIRLKKEGVNEAAIRMSNTLLGDD